MLEARARPPPLPMQATAAAAIGETYGGEQPSGQAMMHMRNLLGWLRLGWLNNKYITLTYLGAEVTVEHARFTRTRSGFSVFRDVVFQHVVFQANYLLNKSLTNIGFRCEVPTPSVCEGQYTMIFKPHFRTRHIAELPTRVFGFANGFSRAVPRREWSPRCAEVRGAQDMVCSILRLGSPFPRTMVCLDRKCLAILRIAGRLKSTL